MKDPAYKKAIKRRRELPKELEKVDLELDIMAQYESLKSSVTSSLRKSLAEKSRQSTHSGPGISKEKQEEIVFNEFLDDGSPAKADRLIEAFSKAGFPIEGANKRRKIARLMRKLNFVYIRGHGYWLRDIPYYKPGHDPSKETEK